MSLRSIILIVFAASWPTIALPQDAFLSGKKLYDDCIASDGADKHPTCASYIMGVADALQLTKHVCMPKDANVSQVVDVVTNYLRAHPEVRTYPATSITGVALREAFPCANRTINYAKSK